MREGEPTLERVLKLSQTLLLKPNDDLKKISLRGGVYLIKRNAEIIYVGKAKNLSRRIKSDHISGEIKNTTSTVRRKITKKFGIPHGKELRQWMNKCNFSTLEIPDSDMRALVESYMIYLLRNKGEPLLND